MTEAVPSVGAQRKQVRRVWPLYAFASVVIIGVGLLLGLWREQSQIATKQRVSGSIASSTQLTPKASPEKASSPSAVSEPGKEKDNAGKIREILSRTSAVIDTDPDKASALLLEAVKLDPTNAQAHFQLGLVYVKQKEYGKAIETYQKVAEMQPQLPDVYFNLGYAYAMSKDYPRAEEMYTRTVKLSPLYLDEALFNLGMVQQRQGKREEAAANFERALSANPKNELARQEVDKSKTKPGKSE